MLSQQGGYVIPSRLHSVSSVRSNNTSWSRYTNDVDEYNAVSSPDDLEDLVQKSQLALTTLARESSEKPATYQDERGSLYYAIDDDWVSTISPISRAPSRHFGSQRMRPYEYMASPTDAGPSFSVLGGSGLHSLGSISHRLTSVRRHRSTRGRLHSSASGAGRGRGKWQRILSERFEVQPSVRSSHRRSLSTTAQECEQEEVDADYEAALERLGASFVGQGRHSSFRSSLALSVPGENGSLRLRSLSLTYEDRPAQWPAGTKVDKEPSPADNVAPEESNAESAFQLRLPPSSSSTTGTASTTSTTSLIAPKKHRVPSPTQHDFSANSQAASSVDQYDNCDTPSISFSDSTPLKSSNRAGPGAHEPDAIAPVHGLGLVAIAIALSLAVFVVGMDVNIISTAIPHITAEFSSLDDIGWYGSAFLMTTCAFQITWGRIYTMFPVKHMFALALVIFEVGSLLCAVSPNSPVFIVGRSVQGVGVSGMLSGALIIVSLVVPLAQRSLLGGIIGAMEGVAMVAAPLVGGFLTDKVSWRWCFYINLPIGAFVFVVIFFFLHVPPQGTPRNSEVAHMAFTQRAIYTIGQLDLLSMVLLIPTIVLVLLALQWGGTKYPWGSLGIILLFVLAAVLASVFAYVQYCKQDRAMVPPRIVKQRTVLAGFWFMLCTSSALVVMTYFLPLWFQTILSLSPSASGVRMLPMLLGLIIAVLASGALVSLVGYYGPFMILGTLLMSVGSGLLSTLSATSSSAVLIVFPALFGVGVGLSFQQPIIAAQTVLSPEDIPIGISVIVFGQSFGAAIVISVAETVFANRLAHIIEGILGPTAGVTAASLLSGATGGDGATSHGSLLSLVQSAGGSAEQLLAAYNKAITESFYVGLAMASLSVSGALLIEWRSVKKPEDAKADNEK